MRNTIKLALAGLVLAPMGTTAASASSAASIKFQNLGVNPVWVTVYTAMKLQLNAQCVASGGTLTVNENAWQSYESAGRLFFRFEYKTKSDCTGSSTYDSGYGGLYTIPVLGSTLNINIPAQATGFIGAVHSS